MRISLINLTSGEERIPDEEILPVIRAINRQVSEDFEPHWHMGAQIRLDGAVSATPGDDDDPHVSLRGDAILYLVSGMPPIDVIGYHSRHFEGVPYGFVYPRGSAELGEHWSVTLSHEALEMLADPDCNLLAKGPHPGKEHDVFHWFEMCDAVQSDTYTVDGVEVSNFVLPHYFTSNEEPGGRNDFLNRGVPSFGVREGGYIGFYDPELGKDDQHFAKDDDRGRRRAGIRGQLKSIRRHDRRIKPSRATSATPVEVAKPTFECLYLEVVCGDGESATSTAREALRRKGKRNWRMKPTGADESAVEAFPPEPLSAKDAWDLAHSLRNDRNVCCAEPMFSFPVGVEPPMPSRASARASGGNDEEWPKATDDRRWSVELINAHHVWPETKGAGIVIGHPDTGYTPHPQIVNRLDLTVDRDILKGDDDARDDLKWSPPYPTPGHGTGTASVIASEIDTDVVGVAPAAKIIPFRVSRSVVLVSMSSLAEAIDLAPPAGCHVVSISMGGLWSSRLYKAVKRAVDRGVIVCAAAGNYVGWVVWPAAYDEVIAVAACNVEKKPWRHSSHGASVDITAPGEAVWRAEGWDEVAQPESRRGNGTSFAVAAVAGAAALWLAKHGRSTLLNRYGGVGLVAVFKELLRKTADRPEGWDTSEYGPGIVNVQKLLSAPLPDRAPARGMLALGARAPDSSRGAIGMIAHFTRATSLSMVRASLPSEAEETAANSDLLSELAFHAATDAAYRDELERVASRELTVGRSRDSSTSPIPKNASSALRALLAEVPTAVPTPPA